MKRWSIHVATWGGTEVRIHATFLLLLASIGLLTLKQGGTAAALEAVIFLVTIFFCVLLHEFGHVIAARRYGIRTPDVTLLPIGGLARMERMPRKPQEELVVALAGPAVNVVIAAGLLVVLLVAPPAEWGFSIVEGSFLLRLMYWNIVMVLFNMIPAFPMDGGRVLRAVLALIIDYARATRWAAAIGQAFAIFGALAAIFYFQNPLLIIIAVFIFMSAGQEAAFVSEQEAIQGLTVRDAMITQFSHLREDAVLKDAVNLLLAGSQHDFPVVNWQGAFIGMLSRTALIAGLDQYGPQHPVAEVMQTCETTLDPRHPLTGAVEHLRASACPALPVIHPSEGSLMGLLTAENVGEMLMVRAALAKGRQSPGSLPA